MRVLGSILAALVAASIAVLGATAQTTPFPETIALPNGWQPEGIATGKGASFYVGSIPTGAVYRGNLRTGEGTVLVQGGEGRAAIGLKVDRRGRIFVAGGPTGKAFVYSATDGGSLATYTLTTKETFINDVAVTRSAAWFTDSVNQVVYRVPLGKRGGVPAQSEVQTVPLTGDIKYQQGFNVNGIAATPNGKRLVIVQSNTGMLFTVDAATGGTGQIDLGGGNVANGDGILLRGKTLYVVQNQQNQVAVIKLASDFASGQITGTLTDPDLDVPTTIASFGSRLYAVNARFGTEPGPTVPYHVVQLPKRS
jgi:sugar lactone lactonase YvrE